MREQLYSLKHNGQTLREALGTSKNNEFVITLYNLVFTHNFSEISVAVGLEIVETLKTMLALVISPQTIDLWVVARGYHICFHSSTYLLI